eukprot:4815841-Prymnesium_polylepis.1
MCGWEKRLLPVTSLQKESHILSRMVNPRIGVASKKDGKRRQQERVAPRSKPTSSSTADVDEAAQLSESSTEGDNEQLEQQLREPERGYGWQEVMIDPSLAAGTPSAADALAAGHSLILLPGAVDNSHLELLKRGAIQVAADPERTDSPLGGGNDHCVRLWVKEAMPDHSADADDVLRQVLSLVDSRLSLL